jgi:DNA-binding response OmpR family regulator
MKSRRENTTDAARVLLLADNVESGDVLRAALEAGGFAVDGATPDAVLAEDVVRGADAVIASIRRPQEGLGRIEAALADAKRPPLVVLMECDADVAQVPTLRGAFETLVELRCPIAPENVVEVVRLVTLAASVPGARHGSGHQAGGVAGKPEQPDDRWNVGGLEQAENASADVRCRDGGERHGVCGGDAAVCVGTSLRAHRLGIWARVPAH